MTTMTVLMKDTRMGEAGTLLLKDSSYTVSTGFGAWLVQHKLAIDTSGALAVPSSEHVGYQIDPVTGGIKDLTASSRSMTHDMGLEGAAVLAGLLADYHMMDGSGTTLTDSSGNGNHGELSSPAPTWTPTGLQCSLSAISYVDLPAALNAAQTILVACYCPPPTGANGLLAATPILWGPSVSGGPAMYLRGDGDPFFTRTRLSVIVGGMYSTNPLETVSGYHILAFVMGASPTKDLIYIDGVQSTAYGTQDSSLGLMVSGNYQLGAGVSGLGTAKSPATFYGAKFFDRRLSDAEIAQTSKNIAFELERRGVYINKPPSRSSSPANTFLAVGDSITFGAGATAYTSMLALSGTFNVVNCGVSGLTAADMAVVLQWDSVTRVTSGPNSVCSILGGINDLLGGSTPADTVSAIFATAAMGRRLGMRTVVSTLPSAIGQDARRNSVNAILRANWPQHADALCDLAANATIGADGAYANTTYFQDGLHPTTAGQTIIAAMESATVNALFAGPCAFSVLPGASVGLEGVTHPITDSTTATFGATITGGGSNHIVAYCNGTNWIVR